MDGIQQGASVTDRSMQALKMSRVRTVATALFAATVLLAGFVPSSLAQTYSVIHAFKNVPDGAVTQAAVIQDQAGNLYGAAIFGGRSGYGLVFGINKNLREFLLYSFSGGVDGANPYASLVRDCEGDLFGTTAYGGKNGYGVVFKVDKDGKEAVLYSFTGGKAVQLP